VEKSTRDSGRKTGKKATGYVGTLTDQDIKASGKMTKDTERDS
jgi:hypothetical protein